MDLYLLKYKGKYRVLAHYDQDTNDIPKDHDGNNDESYADLYVSCANNIEIKHGVGSELSCYIPSSIRGNNIVKDIFQDKNKEEITTKVYLDENQHEVIEYYHLKHKFNTCAYVLNKQTNKYSKKNDYDMEYIKKILIKKDILIDLDLLDGEVYFIFHAKMMDYIANLVKAKTSGANISPFSSKNRPKDKYTIPANDLELYQKSIKDYPIKTMEVRGSTRQMVDGLIIKEQNKVFCEKFAKKLDKNEGNLKVKEWVHKCGLWTEYCDFLKERGK